MNVRAKAPTALAIWAALICVYIFWGSTYLAIRFAVETIPPFLMAGTRQLTAGLILYIWRRLSGDPRPSWVHWRSAAVIGVLLLTIGNGGVSWAEQRVHSGIASLLVGAVPLWMVLLDWLFGRKPAGQKRPNWISLSGVLVGFLGIALLIGPAEVTGLKGGVDMLGAGALLLGSFAWAIGSLYSRKANLPDSPLAGTGMEMITGGVGLFLVGSLTGEWGRLDLAGVAPRSLWGLAYLVVFGSLVGYAAYTWLLRVAPTTLVSTYAYVNPVVAIFLGSLLGQEPVTPRIVLAAAIILSAVAVISLTQPVKRPPKSAAPVAAED